MTEPLRPTPSRRELLRGKAPELFIDFIEPYGKGDYQNAYLGRLRYLQPSSHPAPLETVKGVIQTMPTYTDYWAGLIEDYNKLKNQQPPLQPIPADQIPSLVAAIIEPEASEAEKLDRLALEIRALADTDTFSPHEAYPLFIEIAKDAYAIIYDEERERDERIAADLTD